MVPYKDPKLPIQQRVDDLLNRMTLEEKVAQIRHIHSWNIFNNQELDLDKLNAFVGDLSWGFVEGFPLTGENCRKNMQLIQEYMLTKTRLGVGRPGSLSGMKELSIGNDKSVGKGKIITISGVVRDIQATLVDNVIIRSVARNKELTRTNKRGEYQLEAASDDILIFTKKGYLSQSIPVNNNSSHNARLNYGDN